MAGKGAGGNRTQRKKSYCMEVLFKDVLWFVPNLGLDQIQQEAVTPTHCVCVAAGQGISWTKMIDWQWLGVTFACWAGGHIS